jgi:hypothetical protein
MLLKHIHQIVSILESENVRDSPQTQVAQWQTNKESFDKALTFSKINPVRMDSSFVHSDRSIERSMKMPIQTQNHLHNPEDSSMRNEKSRHSFAHPSVLTSHPFKRQLAAYEMKERGSHPSNIEPVSNVIDASDLHPEKQLSPIISTDAGR